MPKEGTKAGSLSNLPFEKFIDAHGHDEIGLSVTDEPEHIRGVDIIGVAEIAVPGWFAVDSDVIVIEPTLEWFALVLENFPGNVVVTNFIDDLGQAVAV